MTDNGHLLRKWSVRGVVLSILVGSVGHLYYWYWPRPHSACPDPQSPVAGLALGATGPETRLWIPFPHQNLASLVGHLGTLEALGEASEEFLGVVVPELPSFGPFRLPPAREIALAIDEEGEERFAVARVYPLAAWAFRAAGWLASNPWMAGGELSVGQHRIEVSWQGNLWIASARGVNLDHSRSSLEVGPSLGVLRLGRRKGVLPAGVFRLATEENRIVLSSTLTGRLASLHEVWDSMPEGVALSWSGVTEDRKGREIRSLIAFSRRGESEWGLPPLLSLQSPPGSGSGQLPGERILAVLGVEAKTITVGPWELRAYEERLLDFGPDLIEGLETLWRMGEPTREMLVGTLELEEAGQVFRQISETLKQVPIIGESEARRWNALAALSRATPQGSRLCIRVVEPDHVEVEISRRRPD